MATDISFDPKKYAQELAEQSKKILPTGKTMESFQHDLNEAMKPTVSVSYETELRMLKKVLGVLETLTQKGIEWSGIKDSFNKQSFTPEEKDKAAQMVEKYTAPGTASYLTQNGPEPAGPPAFAQSPQTPQFTAEERWHIDEHGNIFQGDTPPRGPEMSPMETLNKMIDTLSHDFLSDVQQTQADTRDGNRKEQRAAMNQTIEECSKKFGISQDNLRAVVAYLRMDPSAPGEGYQQEAQRRLNKVLDAMSAHTPQGEIDKATLEAWKAKVAEASQALKDLQGEWNSLSIAKEQCETHRAECEQAVAEKNQQLSEAEKKLNEMRETLTQKTRQLNEDKNLSPEARATLEKECSNLLQDIETQRELVGLTRDALDQATQELTAVGKELSDAEFELKQKSFEVRSAMMVCALQERMDDAIKHMPLLDDKTQEAKEVSQDVKDLTQDYRELADQYRGLRISIGEKLQQSHLAVLQKMGDALIDWKISDIQKHNEKKTLKTLKSITRGSGWDEFKLEVGGIFNKTSSANIKWHSDRAMKELQKINKLDARIQRQTERAEKQAMREFRRDHRGMTRAQIEQSPEYKAKVKELTERRTQATREKKDKHVQKFQKEYKKVKERTEQRQAVFAKYEKKIEALGRRVDVMREFGDIGKDFDFKKESSFAQDLKDLLPKNMSQIRALNRAAEQLGVSQDDHSFER